MPEPRRVLELKPNKQGRDFLLADLHGCYQLLCSAMEAANFSPRYDRIISVGDIIDRGPDSLACLKLLREPWFFAVRGNHEDMMLASLKKGERSPAWLMWMQNGGDWFADLSQDERTEAKEFAGELERLPFILNLHTRDGRKIGVCHAQAPRLDWTSIGQGENLNPDELWRMLWARDYAHRSVLPRVEGVDLTVHGHTIVNAPSKRSNMLFIDTGACMNHRLRLLEVNEALFAL